MDTNTAISDGSLATDTLSYLAKVIESQQGLSSSVSAFKRHVQQLTGEQRHNLCKKIKSDQPPGWSVEVKPGDRQLQIHSMLLKPGLSSLSEIGNVKIDGYQELSKFLNKHVVTPYKYQESYQHFNPADQPEGLLLLGTDKNSCQMVINELQETLGSPVYQLPEMHESSEVRPAIEQMTRKIKEDSSNYAVVAIDTDRVRQRSIKTLLDQLRCQLKKDNIKEIVLVMASGEEKIPALLLNNKYRVYSFYPRKDLSHQEKVTLQLLISINQYINQHNYSVDDDINWKKIAGQLSNRIPEAMSDKDREDKCTKVVNEFFRKVGKNCAKAGLLKIDQMIVDKCDEQALNQEFEPLDKKLEDFILHGQPELTRFFRHYWFISCRDLWIRTMRSVWLLLLTTWAMVVRLLMFMVFAGVYVLMLQHSRFTPLINSLWNSMSVKNPVN